MICRMTFCASHLDHPLLAFRANPIKVGQALGRLLNNVKHLLTKRLGRFLTKCGPMPLTIPEPRYFQSPPACWAVRHGGRVS